MEEEAARRTSALLKEVDAAGLGFYMLPDCCGCGIHKTGVLPRELWGSPLHHERAAPGFGVHGSGGRTNPVTPLSARTHRVVARIALGRETCRTHHAKGALVWGSDAASAPPKGPGYSLGNGPPIPRRLPFVQHSRHDCVLPGPGTQNAVDSPANS